MTSTSPLALKLQDVFKQYGDHVALCGVSIDVPKGSIFGLLGPNGASYKRLVNLHSEWKYAPENTKYS